MLNFLNHYNLKLLKIIINSGNGAATGDVVKREGADFGIAFDSDFDRCFAWFLKILRCLRVKLQMKLGYPNQIPDDASTQKENKA